MPHDASVSDDTEETLVNDNADLFEPPGTEPPGQQSLWEITETSPPRY